MLLDAYVVNNNNNNNKKNTNSHWVKDCYLGMFSYKRERERVCVCVNTKKLAF